MGCQNIQRERERERERGREKRKAGYVPQKEKFGTELDFWRGAASTTGLLRVSSEVIRRKMRVTPVWKERKIIC
jgi:hypothetical protein